MKEGRAGNCPAFLVRAPNDPLRTLLDARQRSAMIDFAGYSFQDHKACIICSHVTDGYPVLAVAYDADGDLHFTCGSHDHTPDDWSLLGLSHVLEQARAMRDVPPIPGGHCAERLSAGSNWLVAAME
jgi:hypothetical protein